VSALVGREREYGVLRVERGAGVAARIDAQLAGENGMRGRRACKQRRTEDRLMLASAAREDTSAAGAH